MGICQLLVSKGATVDALDSEKCTALQIAASEGYLEICHILVSKGATIDGLDSDNQRALFYAANQSQLS